MHKCHPILSRTALVTFVLPAIAGRGAGPGAGTAPEGDVLPHPDSYGQGKGLPSPPGTLRSSRSWTRLPTTFYREVFPQGTSRWWRCASPRPTAKARCGGPSTAEFPCWGSEPASADSEYGADAALPMEVGLGSIGALVGMFIGACLPGARWRSLEITTVGAEPTGLFAPHPLGRPR
jgi:hypothetical protein